MLNKYNKLNANGQKSNINSFIQSEDYKMI